MSSCDVLWPRTPSWRNARRAQSRDPPLVRYWWPGIVGVAMVKDSPVRSIEHRPLYGSRFARPRSGKRRERRSVEEIVGDVTTSSKHGFRTGLRHARHTTEEQFCTAKSPLGGVCAVRACVLPTEKGNFLNVYAVSLFSCVCSASSREIPKQYSTNLRTSTALRQLLLSLFHCSSSAGTR